MWGGFYCIICSVPCGNSVGSLFNVMEAMIRMVDVLVCALSAPRVMRDVGQKLIDSKCGACFISLQAED